MELVASTPITESSKTFTITLCASLGWLLENLNIELEKAAVIAGMECS